jgi:hypothetical protein
MRPCKSLQRLEFRSVRSPPSLYVHVLARKFQDAIYWLTVAEGLGAGFQISSDSILQIDSIVDIFCISKFVNCGSSASQLGAIIQEMRRTFFDTSANFRDRSPRLQEFSLSRPACRIFRKMKIERKNVNVRHRLFANFSFLIWNNMFSQPFDYFFA